MSGLQLVGRRGPDEIRYAPHRDIVYLYPEVIKTLAERLEDAPYAPLRDWLQKEGVTLDDLAQAQRSYILFLAEAAQSPLKTMDQCLQESGWEDVKWQAKVAAMFYVGSMMTGTYFAGARAANNPEQAHVADTTRSLVRLAHECGQLIRRGRFASWLLRRGRLLRRLVLRSEGVYQEFKPTE